jgi:hypothetical protein
MGVAEAGQIPKNDRIPKTTYATLAPIFFMASSGIKDCFKGSPLKGPLANHRFPAANFPSISQGNFFCPPYNEKRLESQREIGSASVEKVSPSLDPAPLKPGILKDLKAQQLCSQYGLMVYFCSPLGTYHLMKL